jgi:hypothetical protein
MTEVRTKTQLLADFAGGQTPTLKLLDLIESLFSYTDSLETALAAQIELATDVKISTLAGIPVDYTDGSPPATGEGTMAKGSLVIDVTNGKVYINGGTKAEPIWKLVTSAE